MIKSKKMLVLLRILLGVLILLNAAMIFAFSEQDGTDSAKTSHQISQAIAENTVKDFHQKPKKEQNKIVEKIDFPVRKVAHATEFGSLGALIFLFLLTWRGGLLLRYLASLGITFLYACSDELHQKLSGGRHAAFSDTLVDLSGAVLTCTAILALLLLLRHRKKKGHANVR